MTRPRRLARWSARSAAWLLAATGVLLAVAAWRGRAEVREVQVAAFGRVSSVWVVPLFVCVETGPAADFHPIPAGRRFGTSVFPAQTEAVWVDLRVRLATHGGRLGGFGRAASSSVPQMHHHGLAFIPTWFALAALLAPLATLAIGHRRRRGRDPAALCRSCGYDLRASPARCPECGVVPATR